MKRIPMLLLTLLTAFFEVKAQQAPKTLVVEHFTNTYCSVCFNRNPGFYANLANFPQVLHIAYHPSSPYPACPLNQHNKPENDDRANFYGVYGATPRLVLQGEAIPASTDYSDPLILSSRLGQTSSFTMSTRLEQTSATQLKVTVTVKKVDTSSLASLDLYAVLVEDTLHFTGNNGEPLQQDVFRKSFFGTLPTVINTPANTDDSVVHTQTMTINSAWNLLQCYAVAIVSTPEKTVIQASGSSKLPDMPTGMQRLQQQDIFSVYPVPANDRLWLKSSLSGRAEVVVIDVLGKKRLQQQVSAASDAIDLSTLSQGIYFLHIQHDKGIQVVPFSRR